MIYNIERDRFDQGIQNNNNQSLSNSQVIKPNAYWRYFYFLLKEQNKLLRCCIDNWVMWTSRLSQRRKSSLTSWVRPTNQSRSRRIQLRTTKQETCLKYLWIITVYRIKCRTSSLTLQIRTKRGALEVGRINKSLT